MPNEMSDAFVFFGATGDLAYKQIFPSLQDLIRDEGFNIPRVQRPAVFCNQVLDRHPIFNTRLVGFGHCFVS